MNARINNVLSLFALLVLCYTQLSNAAPIERANKKMINSVIARDDAGAGYLTTENTLEARGNIMPGIDRLLPVLNAFGNVGTSGHKEGGKAPVPAA